LEKPGKYIRDFERLAMQTTTARELYDEMLKLYPDWINRSALWSSVLAVRNFSLTLVKTLDTSAQATPDSSARILVRQAVGTVPPSITYSVQ